MSLQPTPSPALKLSFLAGGGEMSRRIRGFDWSATPLGPPPGWPASLKSMVRMALTTRHPIFIFWGPEQICLYNDAYSASLGPEKHPAILGMPGPQAWPEIWPTIAPQIDLVQRGDGATWHENQYLPILRHGELQDVYWTYSYGPIHDEDADGGVGGVLVICTETTQHVLAERALEQSEARFRLAVEAASLGSFDIDLTHGRVSLSPRAQDLFGLPGPALPLADWLACVHPADLPQVQAQLAGARDPQGDGRYRLRHRLLVPTGAPGAPSASPQGTVRWIDVAGRVDREAAGPLPGERLAGVLWDITEQQQMVEALQRADRLKDQFLATLAHELRNPLAPISAAAQLLVRPELPADRVAWCSALIQRQTRTMALLLDDLLEISRISSGKLQIRKSSVDVQTVVAAAAETARPLIESMQHTLRIELPPQPPVLELDPLRIAQVLTNLLNNAAKYTDTGGRIVLAVRVDGGTLHFDVVDNGVGLAPELLPSLFEMFQQVPGTLDRAQGGLGIGLALAKGLVDLHGGRIAAFSAGPGRGSTFTVSLPLTAAAGVAVVAAPSAPVGRPAPQGLPRRRILIADDNVDAARTLAMGLEIEGYQVDVAHDGLHALDLARDGRPHGAFLDIGMPGLDGYALASRLREQPWGREMLLVALTGWGQDGDKRRALSAGFDTHATKPIALDAVMALLADRLQQRVPGHGDDGAPTGQTAV